MRGVVKWFDVERGYGFITPDEGGKDVFCHYSAIDSSGYRSLTVGQAVEYEVGTDKQGRPAALMVRPLATSSG